MKILLIGNNTDYNVLIAANLLVGADIDLLLKQDLSYPIYMGKYKTHEVYALKIVNDVKLAYKIINQFLKLFNFSEDAILVIPIYYNYYLFSRLLSYLISILNNTLIGKYALGLNVSLQLKNLNYQITLVKARINQLDETCS